jgi:hypothetical protein
MLSSGKPGQVVDTTPVVFDDVSDDMHYKAWANAVICASRGIEIPADEIYCRRV